MILASSVQDYLIYGRTTLPHNLNITLAIVDWQFWQFRHSPDQFNL